MIDLSTACAWANERKNGVLITIRKDGRPQSSDIAYVVDGSVQRIPGSQLGSLRWKP